MNNYDLLKSDIEKNVNDLVNDLDLNVESNNLMKNRFVDWMFKNGFEQRTISNYANAISIISREAIVDKIITKSIYEIDNVDEMDELITKLNQNNTYLERKISSHNTNSAAISQYRKFLGDCLFSSSITEADDVLNKFKKYYYSIVENNKDDEENARRIELRNQFNSEYPLSKLKDMTLDEYALGTENYLNTLSYKLEFGEYKYVGMGIGGGTAAKHGIYYAKDHEFHGYKNDIISNPEEYWKEFRNQLYGFLTEYKETQVFPDVKEKYPLVQTIPLIATKLCFLYYPNAFVNIGSKEKLQSIVELFEIETSKEETSSKMSYDICSYFKRSFPERLSDDPQLLGDCLWKFIDKEEIKNEAEPTFEDKPVEIYSIDDFLNEVFIDENKYNSIVSILEKKKNIILEGAPGVGKTFMAKRLAYSILGKKDDEMVKIIQFHQSYSYEDFVEGYRPNESGFKLEKGIFYKLCKKAEQNPNNKYYLIIDEINRGNLSKIFGELLMLIEADKRDEQLLLTYSNEMFCVPQNLYIIGLMNTADRSLALIDYALRRRFSFIKIEPAFDNEKFITAFKEKFDNNYDNIIKIIKKINEAIETDKSLGSGFKIGHSYFCPNIKDRKGTKKDIQDIITYEIIPLLEEYWYDNDDSLIQWKDALDGAMND